MKTKHRTLSLLLLPVLLFGLLAGCAKPAAETPAPQTPAPATQEPAGTQQPEPPKPQVTIRIGYGSDPDYTQLANYKWEELLQSEYGYKVEHYFFDSSQIAHKSMLAGAVDIVATGIVSAMLVSKESKGDKIKLIAADLQAPDHVLVSQASITDLKQLEGKRVGISTPGDISDTLSRIVLQRNGVDVDKVNFLKIGGTGPRMAALLANQIDAGLAHADAGLMAADKGLNILYAVGEPLPGYLQHGLAATDKWLDKNPEVAQNVVNSFIDSVRWAADNRDGYIEYSKQWIDNLPDEKRAAAYDIFVKVNMFAVNGGLSPENLQTTMDLEIEAGTLSEPVPFETWVDTRFVEAYLKANGTR